MSGALAFTTRVSAPLPRLWIVELEVVLLSPPLLLLLMLLPLVVALELLLLTLPLLWFVHSL